MKLLIDSTYHCLIDGGLACGDISAMGVGPQTP